MEAVYTNIFGLILVTIKSYCTTSTKMKKRSYQKINCVTQNCLQCISVTRFHAFKLVFKDFVLFIVSVIVNRLLMPRVVQATVKHEEYEGYFRYAHANIRTNSESLAFCGPEAAIFEKNQQHTKLKEVCEAQSNVFKAQLSLEFATNCNSYLSSIASFLIIAMAIFSGTYDDLTQPELAKMISETSFVCGYLAYQLSRLVEMSVQISKLLGVTFRISEMISEMQIRGEDTQGTDKEGGSPIFHPGLSDDSVVKVMFSAAYFNS